MGSEPFPTVLWLWTATATNVTASEFAEAPKPIEGVEMDATILKLDATNLEPLEVAIEQNGVIIHTFTIADPRTAFCQAFGEVSPDKIAYPISRAIALASSSRREE